MSPFSFPRSLVANNGKTFFITREQWQKNQRYHELSMRYFALPLQEDEKSVFLAVESLENLTACEVFAFLTGKMIEPVVVDKFCLKTQLQQLNQRDTFHLEDPLSNYTSLATQPLPLSQDALPETQQDSMIALLNHLFELTLEKQASDLHLEPQRDGLNIRLRIDGVLHTQQILPLELASRLISRLKLLAKLDISECRLPQDGRFYFHTPLSEKLEFRLSTLPTHYGEKAVLRLQKNTPLYQNFTELGMNSTQCRQLEWALNQPQGLILVTGPTGSGKSISLYSALSWINDGFKHILTAEDPIEVEVQGIVQTQINPSIGLTFARLLRTFLRQDPDVIMLGEIRDEESAEMALRAAQTGHLVLSTLHTNDAPSAITRLQQLGIKSFEIDNALLLVIAQRLIRKICPICHKKHSSPCQCQQGYQGRTGIFQFLYRQKDKKKHHFQLDVPSLRKIAKEKVHQGITDEKEIQRVLGQKEND